MVDLTLTETSDQSFSLLTKALNTKLGHSANKLKFSFLQGQIEVLCISTH